MMEVQMVGVGVIEVESGSNECVQGWNKETKNII